MARYAKHVFTITATTWTPITAPIDCNGFTLHAADETKSFKIRTDLNDPTTEETIGKGHHEEVSADSAQVALKAHLYNRFCVGTIICYAQGVGPASIEVIGTFIK